jgi:predicted RNA-binding Zn ribbon-like protein
MANETPEIDGAAVVVRDFANTLDIELGTDQLDSTESLTRWLRTSGLAPDADVASPGELDLARRLRSGLREALRLNHDGETGPLADLDAALALLPVRLVWDGHAPGLSASARGVLGGLARVALSAHHAVAAGDWARLKICALDECSFAYYDRSKNRSRAYCESGCSNKVKTRAYRARQRAATG